MAVQKRRWDTYNAHNAVTVRNNPVLLATWAHVPNDCALLTSSAPSYTIVLFTIDAVVAVAVPVPDPVSVGVAVAF